MVGVEFIHRQSVEEADNALAQSQQKIQIEDVGNIPEAWALDAVGRLSHEERDLFLKQKILAFSWMPDQVLHTVVHDGAFTESRRLKLTTVGRLSPQIYRKLVRHFLSRSLLHKAVNGLSISKPSASAKQRLSTPQMLVFCALVFCFLGWGLIVSASDVLTVLQISAGIFFLMVVFLRCLCLLPLPKGQGVIAPVPEDADLPIYTVLVPLFQETTVLDQLISALCLLKYPAEKLDIKIILEENDRPMHVAVSQLDLPWNFDVIVVPSGKPQTKPRALNYALQFARGRLLTIYDGEDIPQPNQLRLSAAQFAASGRELGCLQASLAFYNPAENWLTRGIMSQTP